MQSSAVRLWGWICARRRKRGSIVRNEMPEMINRAQIRTRVRINEQTRGRCRYILYLSVRTHEIVNRFRARHRTPATIFRHVPGKYPGQIVFWGRGISCRAKSACFVNFGRLERHYSFKSERNTKKILVNTLLNQCLWVLGYWGWFK